MVAAQAAYAEVALLNTAGVAVAGVKTLIASPRFDLRLLDAPFSRPDLVVFHELYRVPFIAIYKKLKKAKIPYVIIPHGGLNKRAQHTKRLKKAVANALLFNGYFKASAAIQYLSAAEAESTVIRGNSFVCGNGTTIPKLQKEAFLKKGISFLYIGRFTVAFKGLDMLLEAIAQMKDTLMRAGCRFYLYGPDDEDKAFIQSLARKKALDDLVVIGDGIFGKEKEAAILQADYFIQPSRAEGMPMGVLEALSYALPCLVTEGTGLSSFIEEAGAGFAAPSSTEGVCILLRSALENQESITRLSENARRLAEERFDVACLARSAVAHYQQLVGTKEE